jgi:hypothetical protein
VEKKIPINVKETNHSLVMKKDGKDVTSKEKGIEMTQQFMSKIPDYKEKVKEYELEKIKK